MLKITNFQSHTNSELDILPNAVNVIVGETDAGKSAIIRSIELLARNRPSGDKYRTHGTKETRVEWKGVTRVRDNTAGSYIVDGVEYKALRSEVPRQVTEKLQLSEINFRPQHAAYFLLNDSPGSVARAMNELADLGLIDYTTAEIKRQKGQNAALIEVKAKDLEKKEEEVKSLAWAVDADVDLAVIEEVESARELTIKMVDELSSITRQLQELEDRLNSYPDFDSSKVDDRIVELKDTTLDVISRLVSEAESCLVKLDSYPDFDGERLSEIYTQISDNQLAEMIQIIDKLEEYDNDLRLCPDPADDIAVLGGVKFADSVELKELLFKIEEIESRTWPDNDWAADIEEIEMRVNDWNTLWERKEQLTELMDYLNRYSSLIDEGVLAEEQATEIFNNLLEECGVCPLCNEKCGGGHGK